MNPDNEKDLATEIGNRFDEIFGTDSKYMDEFGETTIIKVAVSPIRDLKSLILSMDWEITDQVLARFGEELIKLEKIYSDNRILLQLLQILGALSKYIRSKGVDSHPESIKLLHSVFNCLEDLVIQKEIPPVVQKQRLKHEIEKFKTLKKKISDRHRPLPIPAEPPAPSPEDRPEPPIEVPAVTRMETPAGLAPDQSLAGYGPADLPGPGAETEPARGPSPDHQQVMDQTGPGPGLSGPPLEQTGGAPVSTAEIISGMSPHEAFAYALDELKNILKSEFSAIRAELRMWRQGQ